MHLAAGLWLTAAAIGPEAAVSMMRELADTAELQAGEPQGNA